MTYFVYLIGNCKTKKFISYVGYTNNLKKENIFTQSRQRWQNLQEEENGNWYITEKYKTVKEKLQQENTI